MEHTTNTLYYNNFGQLIVIFCLYGQTILRKVVKSGKFLITDLTVFCCLRLDYLHYFGLCLILLSICVHCACDRATTVCVNNISMIICSVLDFKPLKCPLHRRLIIYSELYKFFVFRLCYGDIKLFKMVCFDPKLHFFENNRENTEIRTKSFLTLDGKVHILLLLTPKLAL